MCSTQGLAGDQAHESCSAAAREQLCKFFERVKLILKHASPDEAANICRARGIPLARSPPATTSPDNFLQGAALMFHLCVHV